MVFQNYALYPHMTVFENIAFPLRARRRRHIGEAELETRVKSVADILGVGELLHRYPKELSGGQQQRVALGRAMVRDPEVFLLDEPLSNLDARLRIRMRHDLKALHDRIGSTIIYVTHDQAEAMSMSTRIAVFAKGRLQQFASPFEIYNRPANTFVANFVGDREIVFVEGDARVAGDRLTFESGQLNIAVAPVAAGYAQLDGRRVTLGIRAEGVRLVSPEAAEGVAAVVTVVEPAGPDVVVFAETESGLELCCRADVGTTLARGTPVRLALIAERLQVFDPRTEQAFAVHA